MTLTEGMVSYPKDVPFQRTLQRDMQKGDPSNVSQFEMSAHSGTHVDAPLHFCPDGYGADEIPISNLYGSAYVADCLGEAEITAELLKRKVPVDVKRLLLKTDNSTCLHDNPQAPFKTDYVYLTATGAEFIVQRGIRLVGIDYLTIDKYKIADKPTHNILLENNVTILEGIILHDVPPGEYFLACGPLKMARADGAPCRAVLIENLI